MPRQTWLSTTTCILSRLFVTISLPLVAFAPAHFNPNTITLPVVDGNDVRFRRMSTAAGLSQTRVGQIVQDDRGFIWFGTAYGLNRYDGYRFTVFAHDPKHSGSLGGVQVSALFKDRSGTLWVGCNHLLDRFNPLDETFTHYKLEAADQDNAAITIFNIYEDDAGILWLSAGNKGLYRFDPATGKVTHYTHDPNNSASIGSTDVVSTGQDRSGAFWIGHRTGLDRFDRTTGQVTSHLPLEDRSWLQFHEDRYRVFWLIYGADNTLATLDRQHGTVTRYPIEGEGLSDNKLDSVFWMFEDRDGVMWFATRRNGLLKLDRSKKRFVRYRNNPDDDGSLAADRVTTIFQDREGNFWIGLDEAPPNFFSSRPPLFENLAQASAMRTEAPRKTVVFKDSGGTVWLGSEKALWKIRRNTDERPQPDSSLSSVVSMSEQQPDVLWLAGNFRGLIRMRQKSGEVKVYRPDPSNPNGLNTNQIERILIAHNGTPWLATWDGLAKLDLATDRFTTYRNKIGSGYHTLVEDVSGKLWLGSEQGLQEFDPASGGFTTYGNDTRDTRTISDNRVGSVFFDHSGVLWAGTQNGLNRFDQPTHTFTSFFERDGLAGNVVSCILEDDRHFLWMSTNHGVSRLAPDRKTFNNYGLADGLPGTDLTGWGTCYKSPDGEMFFSGYSGAVAFHPDRADAGGSAPQMSLTGFRLFGAEVKSEADSPLRQSIVTSSALTLAHWQNFFSLEFAALSYHSPSTTRYRYRLENVDGRWIEVAGNQRVANYTSISPGVYTFRVQGATSRGPWSEPGTALRIEVLPPWWSTWWFRLGCLLAAMLAAFTAYRIRVAQITGELGLRFEERLAERTRIARELHDTLLQSFHGLLFRFQTARNMLPRRPEEAVNVLDGAIAKAEQALAEGRDAIQDLRSQSPVHSDLEHLLTEMGLELARSQDAQLDAASFRVIVEGVRQTLRPVLQDELCRIAHELLRNAFRHAEARHIEAEIRYEARLLRLRVRDDGKGIDPMVLRAGGRAGHWGLAGIRERAKQIGARLDFWSKAGAGTEVELTVPASMAYVASLGGSGRYLGFKWLRGKQENS